MVDRLTTPICPECGAGPEKQCDLRFLAANCPRRKSIESETREPIPMMLFCPRCHEQHVDAPEPEKGWTNPPHATHTCQHCGTLWRPSNHNTTGVFHIGVLEPKHGARIAACWPSSAALEYQRPGDEIRAELRNGSVVYFGSAEAAVRIEQLAPVSATRESILEEAARTCEHVGELTLFIGRPISTEAEFHTIVRDLFLLKAQAIRALKRHDDIHDVERKP